jgi:hypothetical protein
MISMPLKSYHEQQTEQTVVSTIPQPTIPSGIGCTETQCEGEMYYLSPEQKHPEYPNLKRAHCIECGWRGWC